MAIIHKIKPTLVRPTPQKRVAAYARVSKESEQTLHSLSAQVSHYSSYIQNNPMWQYAGVYADEGISGTSRRGRDEFNRMMRDCAEGRIDIILTKSISRFARNTVDLLKAVRQLKSWGVEVRFEREHINTLSEDGEFLLTLLAAFAQEEATATGANIKWALRQGYTKGKYHGTKIYGYRWNGKEYVIEPEEAKIVRLIYKNYLAGMSAEKTKAQLDAMGVRARNGGEFNACVIREILSNITYTGNILLQKSFVESATTKKCVPNKGELAQYLVKGTHEPIIDEDIFMKVQAEIKHRRELGQLANMGINLYCFSKRIRCEKCGKNFTRDQRSRTGQIIWVCNSRRLHGTHACSARAIPDLQLRKILSETLGMPTFDEKQFLEQVDHVGIPGDGIIKVYYKEGIILERTWENTARQDSQTPALKRERVLARSDGSGRGKKSWLTGKIKCGVCGRYYHKRYRRPDRNGVRRIYWKCPSCKGKLVYEEDIINAYKPISKGEFDAVVDYILREDIMEFHFYDGEIVVV